MKAATQQATRWLIYDYLPTIDVGEKLKGEEILSGLCGVSKPTLREMFIVLWWDGIISIEHGKPKRLLKNPDSNFIQKCKDNGLLP